MTTPLVLPDRGGPSGNTARSGRANSQCSSSVAPSTHHRRRAGRAYASRAKGPRQPGSRGSLTPGAEGEAMIASITTSVRTARISAIAQDGSRSRSATPRPGRRPAPVAVRSTCGAARSGATVPARPVCPPDSFSAGHRRLLLQQPLDPRAQKPPRPPKLARRQLPAARKVIDGRHRKVQKLGDLRGGHHLIPGQRHATSLVARAGHLRGAVSMPITMQARLGRRKDISRRPRGRP